MNLSDNNFYKSQVTKRFKLSEKEGDYYDTKFTRYTYETQNAIYDVDVNNENYSKTYHMNCGSGMLPNNIHKAIKKHFELK